MGEEVADDSRSTKSTHNHKRKNILETEPAKKVVGKMDKYSNVQDLLEVEDCVF